MSGTLVSKILVLGGGIGGMTAGIVFGRMGVDVEIVEKSETNLWKGVGIIQNANALRVLKSLGLMQAVLDEGFQMDERRFCDDMGETVCSADALRSLDPNLPAINNITRERLQRILDRAAADAGATLRTGDTIETLSQKADRVDVRFASGREETYDLVIGADGIRSQLRAMLFGEDQKPRFVGYGFWRMMLPRPDWLDFIGVYQGRKETKIGLVPLSKEEMYLFLVTNEPGNPWFTDDQKLPCFRERIEGFDGFCGEIREGLSETDEITYSPAEQVELPSPWYRGRVVLIGDASHAILPHMAQGAAMAMEDAWVLGDLAQSAGSVSEMLELFMERRYDRCLFVQKASRAAADSQQTHDPEELRKHLKHMGEILPGIWRKTDERMAEPI